MAVGAIWKASIIWDVGGASNPEVNVFHYRQAGPEVQPTAPEDLAIALIEDVIPSICNVINGGVSTSLVKIRGISDPTEGGDYVVSPTQGGALAGQAYALQANPLISWRTGLIGRHYQGRNWLPAPDETSVGLAGSVAGTYLGNLQLAAVAIMNVSGTATHTTYDLVVHSEPGPGGSGWMGANTVVTSYSIQPYLKTQRRRGL